MKADIPQGPESGLMRRAADRLDARQALDVIEYYSSGLNLLDAYDHKCLTRPAGSSDCYVSATMNVADS